MILNQGRKPQHTLAYIGAKICLRSAFDKLKMHAIEEQQQQISQMNIIEHFSHKPPQSLLRI